VTASPAVVTAVVRVAATSTAEVNMTIREATAELGKSGCVNPKVPSSTAQAAKRPPAR
jgi:hypothetical protein